MFPQLETALEAIRAIRNCPAVRRLCLDCWGVAVRSGEEEGLKWAAMIRSGVAAYAEHAEQIARMSLSRTVLTQRGASWE